MAGYAGNIKLKGYLGNVKVKGYLGDVKVLGGEPWEEALDLVGYSASSLGEALSNSDAMIAVAGNSEATTIMKDNYSAEMTTAIDSGWNEGLNLLNYKCKLKCYLYKAGNKCSNITGGWTAKWDVVFAGASQSASTNYESTIRMYFRRTNGDGLYRDTCNAYTTNSIDVTGYSNINWTITQISSKGKKQFMYGDSYYHEGVTTVKTHVFTAKNGVQKFRWTDVPHSDVGDQECRLSDVYLTP